MSDKAVSKSAAVRFGVRINDTFNYAHDLGLTAEDVGLITVAALAGLILADNDSKEKTRDMLMKITNDTVNLMASKLIAP